MNVGIRRRVIGSGCGLVLAVTMSTATSSASPAPSAPTSSTARPTLAAPLDDGPPWPEKTPWKRAVWLGRALVGLGLLAGAGAVVLRRPKRDAEPAAKDQSGAGT